MNLNWKIPFGKYNNSSKLLLLLFLFIANWWAQLQKEPVINTFLPPSFHSKIVGILISSWVMFSSSINFLFIFFSFVDDEFDFEKFDE